MRRFLMVVLGVFMLVMTVLGAQAYSDWTQYAVTAEHHANATDDTNVMFTRIKPGTTTFTSNCSFNGYASHGALIDQTYHYIWLLKTNTLEIDDANCNVLDEINLGGASSGNGVIYDWDGDGYPNFLVALSSNITSFEFNGTNLYKDKTIAGVVGTPSGLVCDQPYMVCGFADGSNYFKFLNLTDFSLSQDGLGVNNIYYKSGYSTLSATSGVTGADIDNDGRIEAIIPVAYATFFYPLQAIEFELATHTRERSTSISTDSVALSYFAPVGLYYYGQIGSASSLPEILATNTIIGGGNIRSNWQILDAGWVNKSQQTVNNYTQMSNFMVGDYNYDQQNEFCGILRNVTSNMTLLNCYSGSYALLSSCNMTSQYQQALPSVWTMMVTSSGVRFVSALGIFDQSCNKVLDFGMSDLSTYNGQFIPADVNNDNLLDLIYTDGSVGKIYKSSATTVPEINETDACYDATGELTHYYPINFNPLPIIYEINTEEFDFTLGTGASALKLLLYRDFTIFDDFMYGFLNWVQINGTTSIEAVGGWSDVYNASEIITVCTDCFSANTKHHYKIVSFPKSTSGLTFYNSTSHAYQPILSGTYSIQIDNSPTVYYNIPAYANVIQGDDTNLLSSVFGWTNGIGCVENYNFTQDFVTLGGTEYNYTQVVIPPAGYQCQNNQPSYGWPVVWSDPFQYNNTIAAYGWGGYPFRIGQSPQAECNILFYNRSKTGAETNFTFVSSLYYDFSLQFDFGAYNPSFVPCSTPVEFTIKDRGGNYLTRMNYTQDFKGASSSCKINMLCGGVWTEVGNWNGIGLETYKLAVNMTNQSAQLYYTNYSYGIGFLTDNVRCPFITPDVVYAKTIGFKPNFAYSSTQWGFWLDSFVARATISGLPEYPTQNVTNYCYFAGCLFHDHFNYNTTTYGHGWYSYTTVPVNSVISIGNNSVGLEFVHPTDIFISSSAENTVVLQFRAIFATTEFGVDHLAEFYLYDDSNYAMLFSLSFGDGNIYDSLRGSLKIGTYPAGSWHDYTAILNLATKRYSFYVDSNQIATNQVLNTNANAVSKFGINTQTTDNPLLKLDYVTVSKTTSMVSGLITAEDTGVNPNDLQAPYTADNKFDWSRCTDSERASGSQWCFLRLNGLWALGSVTNFVLANFLYFIIICIIFVLITPYIVPKARA